MPLPPRYAEGTENSFLETAFRKTSFMEHYPILQKQLLFGSSSCFGSLEQNVFVLLNDKSRMKGDFHVRFREKFEVKVLLLNYTQTRQGFTIPFLIVFPVFWFTRTAGRFSGALLCSTQFINACIPVLSVIPGPLVWQLPCPSPGFM